MYFPINNPCIPPEATLYNIWPLLDPYRGPHPLPRPTPIVTIITTVTTTSITPQYPPSPLFRAPCNQELPAPLYSASADSYKYQP